MLFTILLIVLVLMLIGAVPAWPYARNWGSGPAGILLTVVILLVVLMAFGVVPRGW